MSDILRRILDAQTADENPFSKDADGRILELTGNQGEVFTGYYQADDGTYYTEKDWLEQQRQLELERLAEEEYRAQQATLKAQRQERERKAALLQARAKEKAKSNTTPSPFVTTKRMVIGILLIVGSLVLAVVFWPSTNNLQADTTPDVVLVDTLQTETPPITFGNAIITGEDVRMRAEPNIQAKIITFFPKQGEGIELITAATDSLNWAQVRRENGTTGWVYGDYVQKRE